MRKLVNSGSHFEVPIGFSHASRIDNYIAVSGTAPIDNGKTVFIGDLYKQTRYCLELSLQAIIEAGGSIKDVIRTRIMLTNISQWQESAKAHGKFFSQQRPACTFVEVNGFIDPNWLVETEMDAIKSAL
ncbi:RidA family protein [uncultured Microbulbifer sp.]|uniref:RidA family protein n=1 Tax=uncultured Microbulbifer sp. TaxID=348147 RepID=UPI00260ADC49|nr:RidA family protein [uncultured Microbulbifer sp.]